MTHAHLSMRYNRDVDDAARAIRSLVRGHGTASLTEARRFGGAMGELDGFRLVQHRGTSGQPECALLVAADDFVCDFGPVRLSNVPIPRRAGWYNYAVGAVTRSRGGILGIHMPSGVEGRTGFRDDHPAQVRAYRAQIGALRQYVAEHPNVNEIWADWNLDPRLPWVRAYLARHFPDFRIVAPDTGTHGPRVIDYALIRNGHGDWTATAVNNPASDHEAVIATLQESRVTTYPAPSPTYIGPPRNHGGGGNKPINRIVIHSTVSPCAPGQARKTALYFKSTSRNASAHYAVDPAETIQCLYDSLVGYHAPPNGNSLGIEMCEYPSRVIARWDDANHKAMLKRTARLTAELCLAYDVPPWFRSARALKAGKRGITTHEAVGQAWGQTNHWDPGSWPRLRFMRMVRAEIVAIKGTQRPRTPSIVERARLLLEEAKDRAKRLGRKQKIQSGLDELPPR